MKRRFVLVLSVLSILFFSCEKEIEFDAEDVRPRLTIQGQFETDSLWKIRLTHSLPVLDDNEISPVENGSVIISDVNGNPITTLSYTADGYYTSNSLAPVAGNSYRIDVTASGYEAVHSINHAPAIIPIQSLDTSTVYVQSEEFKRFNLTMKDPANAGNFYIIRPVEIYWYPVYDQFNNIIDSVFQYRSVYTKSSSVYVSNSGDKITERLFLNDQLMNGNQVNIVFDVPSYYTNGRDFGVMLYHVTEEYYLFQLTLDKYFEAYYDPFAQPVVVFNNIENGRGIFAGYSRSIIHFLQ